MEIWGGLECTINRVGDEYMDQLEYSGHYNRRTDLDLLAGLGIKKLRYPVLWEKHQPEQDQEIDWTYTSDRLSRLRELNVEPIAGLVHHGSGPAYVNIAEDSFVDGLAEYAAKVASEFPWIKYYTPVNEPLTTARFCGLYGIWHPHGLNSRTFLRILLNECKATALAMEAIRKINPDAMLVQTEDMGRTHSTPKLRYQAEFENHRRWLSLDLLCGKVDAHHPLYQLLTSNGITEDELTYFVQNPCPPDIIGINHYVTSERYLDENLSVYPQHTHGGNGKHEYADVEVVRVGSAKAYGPYRILKEVWNRYKLPIAVTEVHLHCTREEQMRWFNRVHADANRLRNEQADVRAVTAWALLGSFGWNCLLRQACGDYEAGVFDVSSGTPRPTAMSTLIREVAAGRPFSHPLLQQKGWWERDIRILYHKTIPLQQASRESKESVLLVVAKSGIMGSTFARLCELRNIPYKLLSPEELNPSISMKPEVLVSGNKIWAIVDAVESHSFVQRGTRSEPDLNSIRKSGALAAFAKIHKIQMVTFSHDPFTEHHVMLQNPDALMIRTSIFSAAHSEQGHRSASSPKRVQRVSFTSTDVRELVNNTLDLLLDNEKGIWHLIDAKQQYQPARTGTDENIRVYRI